MTDDRQAILNFFSTWQEASKKNDMPTLMNLMAEDVVFLRAGHPPMVGRAAYEEAFQQVQHDVDLKIVDWRVEELNIEGNWAYCWTFLIVSVTPRAGAEPMQMGGNILSILRKTEDGRWVLARDANMLMPMK